MKEITKKFLEAGIVDRTMARMLERWGMLSPEELEQAQKPERIVKETLEQFLEELELLNQPEVIERKEVQLDPLLIPACAPEYPCGQRWCRFCQIGE